jgi:hypothetical protein
MANVRDIESTAMRQSRHGHTGALGQQSRESQLERAREGRKDFLIPRREGPLALSVEPIEEAPIKQVGKKTLFRARPVTYRIRKPKLRGAAVMDTPHTCDFRSCTAVLSRRSCESGCTQGGIPSPLTTSPAPCMMGTCNSSPKPVYIKSTSQEQHPSTSLTHNHTRISE